MVTAETFKRGLNKGIVTTWELTKVVVPVYIFVTFLSYTPVLEWLAGVCQPFMYYLGLPGEASLALVMGYALNIYAAIGVITSLALSSKEITILAVMLLLCHSLPVETAVAKRTGVSGTIIITLRVLLSIFSGLALNWLM
ncbi:MAG: nucleoside recognition protein [Desulfotomaculum sp.]|nr:nucleoside recognition protein [Desulfotomaculum sp.]